MVHAYLTDNINGILSKLANVSYHPFFLSDGI